MGYPTPIEWCDATWNPVGGCSIASPGCSPCYAQRLAGTRLKNHPLYKGTTTNTAKGKPVFNGNLTARGPNDPTWIWPLKWKGAAVPRRGIGSRSTIFVGDMSDLLHEDRSLGYFMRVLDVTYRCPHIMQVLTKRADVLARAVTQWMDLSGEDFATFKGARGPAEVRAAHTSGRAKLFADMCEVMGTPPVDAAFPTFTVYPTFDWAEGHMRWPSIIENMWLGFSAERQKEFDERWDAMRTVAMRGWTIFVSYEPALGPLVLPDDFLALGRRAQVIAGGMSGPEAKPIPDFADWCFRLKKQCYHADVAFFMKQMPLRAPVPTELMLREFPS